MKALILAAVAAMGFLVFIATLPDPIQARPPTAQPAPAQAAAPQPTLPERINIECWKAFGSDGADVVDRCRVALSIKILEDGQRAKLLNAYDRAR